MARNILVDAGFLVSLLTGRHRHHQWTMTQAAELPPRWSTCEAVFTVELRRSRSPLAKTRSQSLPNAAEQLKGTEIHPCAHLTSFIRAANPNIVVRAMTSDLHVADNFR
ncbi:MAG: hypothetical protein WB630_15860 [Candidatus Acidiferrales bacterium]